MLLYIYFLYIYIHSNIGLYILHIGYIHNNLLHI